MAVARDPLPQEICLVAVPLGVLLHRCDRIVVCRMHAFAEWHGSNRYPGIWIGAARCLGGIVCSVGLFGIGRREASGTPLPVL